MKNMTSYMDAVKRGIFAFVLFLISGIAACESVAADSTENFSVLSQNRLQFIAGVASLQNGDAAQAAQIFEPLRAQYPELRDYAQFFLATAYRDAGEFDQAIAAFQEFFAQYPDHPLSIDAQFDLANTLFDAARYAEAIQQYQQLIDQPEINQGDLYNKLGQAYLNLKNYQSAAAAWHQLVSFYPGHSTVGVVKAQLQRLLKSHPEFQPAWTEESWLAHANALLKAGQYLAAIKQYGLFEKRYPTSAALKDCELSMIDAYLRAKNTAKAIAAIDGLIAKYGQTQQELIHNVIYLLGSAYWKWDRNQQTIDTMLRIVNDTAKTSWTENAYYVIGRVYQGEKAYQTASKWFWSLATVFPNSAFAEEAFWRAGWTSYLAQRYADAEQRFSQSLTQFPAGKFYEECLYWKGRTYERLQQPQAALDAYRQLFRNPPDSYYTVLAQNRLQSLKSPIPPLPEISRPADETLPVLLKKLEPLVSAETFEQLLSRTNKALELREVQLWDYADKELAVVAPLFNAQGEPSEQQLFRKYVLCRLYQHVGNYLDAIQLAAAIESQLKQSPQISFPYNLETLKYPLAYWELIKTYAEQNALDPFLVAGIIRQESAYNPHITSSANAMGLMQVIPPTGKRVAKQLKFQNFTPSQLYDPETNIAIGTAYFAGLLEKFDGNVFRAIAGYNAGPNATAKWWKAPGDTEHSEEVVEDITYKATRDYVKQVFRNQLIYRRIYAPVPRS